MTPRRYPRLPHLVAGRGTPDDEVLDDPERDLLLGKEVVVEEKLDGANVSLWAEDGVARVALRGGPDAVDRAGQLGRLRAWLGGQQAALADLLAGGAVAYCEWLLLTHTVVYDRLPGYLVVLDVLDGSGRWLVPDERDRRCTAAGLPVPPEIWRGVPRSVRALEGLAATSSFGSERVEGLVVRTVDGSEPRLAKLVLASFSHLADAEWSAGRPRNRLAPEAVAWR